MAKLLTTAEAAERLGITKRRVNALIAAGRLKASRIGQINIINENDLKSVADRKPGKPPKAKAEGATTAKRTTTKATAKKGGKK
jgi:excisionase family DNA binding protein